MIVYEDRELFLMTSVVYSENFEAVGKRMQEVCTLSPPLLWMNDFSRFFFCFFCFFFFFFFIDYQSETTMHNIPPMYSILED